MKTVIIKIGGSILSPSKEKLFDFDLAQTIGESLMSIEDHRFILIAGGGALARMYQEELKNRSDIPEIDVHWAGLSANNHNAMMLRVALGENAHEDVLTLKELEKDEPIEFANKKFKVVGAGRPGHSGDISGFIMAKRSSSNLVISMKDVDAVYSEDPDKNPNATKYKKLTWDEYMNIIGTEEFKPKGAFPVDPITAKKCKQEDISFIILDGSDLDNLLKAIKEEVFNGTTISNV